jgi:hypothetical protein
MSDEWSCPYCGCQPVTLAERERHEAGVDATHLSCPHQDIDAIKAREQPRRVSLSHAPW